MIDQRFVPWCNTGDKGKQCAIAELRNSKIEFILTGERYWSSKMESPVEFFYDDVVHFSCINGWTKTGPRTAEKSGVSVTAVSNFLERVTLNEYVKSLAPSPNQLSGILAMMSYSSDRVGIEALKDMRRAEAIRLAYKAMNLPSIDGAVEIVDLLKG